MKLRGMHPPVGMELAGCDGEIARKALRQVPGIGCKPVLYPLNEPRRPEEGEPLLPAKTYPYHMVEADKVVHVGVGDEDEVDLQELARRQNVEVAKVEKKGLLPVLEIDVDPGFGGWLKWQLLDPTGTQVFSEWFDSNNPGRQTLPKTGTYKIVVMSPQEKLDQFGTYSFRLRAIAPDQQFTIHVGDTVSDGVPAVGAGRIEVAGAQDIY